METADFNMLDKQFAYNLWANDKLFGLCSTLSEMQLAVTAEGVYGNIQSTLAHLVNAEAYYVRRVSGEWLFSDGLDCWQLSAAELHDWVKVTSGRLAEIASTIDAEKPHALQEDDGTTFRFQS